MTLASNGDLPPLLSPLTGVDLLKHPSHVSLLAQHGAPARHYRSLSARANPDRC